MDNQEARAPQFIFCQLIYRWNLGEIKGFCPKSCYLRPTCNLFINVIQQQGPDLPHGTEPGAPLSDDKTFFWSSPIFGEKILQKNLHSARGSTQYKSGPVNNMVSKRDRLFYHFSITIHLHS